MRVLISNDDGPPSVTESPFILPFIEHLENLGWNVKVALPDSQKSWVSKSFMTHDEIVVRYYNRLTKTITSTKSHDKDFVVMNGTPATCVNIALNNLFKDEEFDLVIAGPNVGNNITTLYTLASGTVGAAMEGVLNNRKAVSVSFGHFKTLSALINCCQMASHIILHLYKQQWPENSMFNVNLPMVEHTCPIHLTDFHKASYGSLFDQIGDTFVFSPDKNPFLNDAEFGTDKYAILNNCASGTYYLTPF